MNSFYLICLWIGYNLLDVITTHIGILNGHIEANPIPALIVNLTSPMILPVYKLSMAFLWLGVVVCLARRWPRVWLALRIGNILVCGAVCWNFVLIGLS
ncbi:MAG: DUF5658 family protein [Ardenticatenaceae bacterium]|nr:DUF5658 family protein [Ardenticatenaceae bacterium]HBY97404.1 hypothetical protein [Chloroflexota bacterium]